MRSTTYAVQDDVQLTEQLDGLAALPPVPVSIKEQMPGIAGFLQELAANMGREHVAGLVKASIELRRAYDRDDFRAVGAAYGSGRGWVTCCEAGYQLGVPEIHMAAFAKRHRGGK